MLVNFATVKINDVWLVEKTTLTLYGGNRNKGGLSISMMHYGGVLMLAMI